VLPFPLEEEVVGAVVTVVVAEELMDGIEWRLY
jgi:hypothetical protein